MSPDTPVVSPVKTQSPSSKVAETSGRERVWIPPAKLRVQACNLVLCPDGNPSLTLGVGEPTSVGLNFPRFVPPWRVTRGSRMRLTPGHPMPLASDPGALRAFLEHPSRPAGALSYHELQGFLFTVVSARSVQKLERP